MASNRIDIHDDVDYRPAKRKSSLIWCPAFVFVLVIALMAGSIMVCFNTCRLPFCPTNTYSPGKSDTTDSLFSKREPEFFSFVLGIEF